jgi:hypothetical protein
VIGSSPNSGPVGVERRRRGFFQSLTLYTAVHPGFAHRTGSDGTRRPASGPSCFKEDRRCQNDQTGPRVLN